MSHSQCLTLGKWFLWWSGRRSSASDIYPTGPWGRAVGKTLEGGAAQLQGGRAPLCVGGYRPSHCSCLKGRSCVGRCAPVAYPTAYTHQVLWSNLGPPRGSLCSVLVALPGMRLVEAGEDRPPHAQSQAAAIAAFAATLTLSCFAFAATLGVYPQVAWLLQLAVARPQGNRRWRALGPVLPLYSAQGAAGRSPPCGWQALSR